MTRMHTRLSSHIRASAVAVVGAIALAGCSAEPASPLAVPEVESTQPSKVAATTDARMWDVPVEICADDPEAARYDSLRRALDSGFLGITSIVRASAVGAPEAADDRWKPPLDRSTFVVEEKIFENMSLHATIGLDTVEAGDVISTFTVPKDLVASQYYEFFDLDGASNVVLMLGSAGTLDGYRIFGVAQADGWYVPSDICAAAVPELVDNAIDVLGLGRLGAVLALAEYRSLLDSQVVDERVASQLPRILET